MVSSAATGVMVMTPSMLALGREKWITDEIRARRVQSARIYEGAASLEELHELGRITLIPNGERVLLRAIIQSDCSEFALDSNDARSSFAHEVVAIGGAVAKWYDDHHVPVDTDLARCRVRVGDDCFVLSTAADRLSKTNPNTRLWMAHIEDISAHWSVGR